MIPSILCYVPLSVELLGTLKAPVFEFGPMNPPFSNQHRAADGLQMPRLRKWSC